MVGQVFYILLDTIFSAKGPEIWLDLADIRQSW